MSLFLQLESCYLALMWRLIPKQCVLNHMEKIEKIKESPKYLLHRPLGVSPQTQYSSHVSDTFFSRKVYKVELLVKSTDTWNWNCVRREVRQLDMYKLTGWMLGSEMWKWLTVGSGSGFYSKKLSVCNVWNLVH